jgi:outer membrane biosynthesis protein TonB
LRKEINFKWLRLYFLVSIGVSLTLPSLKYLPEYKRTDIVSIPTTYIPNWVDNSETFDVTIGSYNLPNTQSKNSNFPIHTVLVSIYFIGVAVVFLKFILGLFYLIWLMIIHKVKRVDKDLFVFIEKPSTPFSFFNFIFINRNDAFDPQKNMILQHERIHIRQMHSVDIILVEMVSMFQWFNPFIWLTKHALAELHEYLADSETIKEQDSSLEYQQLLLNQVCNFKNIGLSNGFKNSITKKRMIMITKNKQSRKWIAILILLVATIILADVSSRIGILKATSNSLIKPVISILVPELPAPTGIEKEKKVNDKNKNKTKKISAQNCDVKYDTVSSPLKTDSMHKTIIAYTSSGNIGYDNFFSVPELFNGTTCIEESQKAYKKFIKDNLKYPRELAGKEISGTVHIYYEINENGKVQNVRCGNDQIREYYKDVDKEYQNQPDKLSRVKESLSLLRDDPYLIAEAIRVISLQPDYTPAKNKEGKAVTSYNSYDIFFISPKDAKQNMSYRDYIKTNLKYPKNAIDRKAEGSVYLKYDLDKDNKYGNIKIANDDMRKYYTEKGIIENLKNITDDPDLANEAIRLLKERPGYYIENFDTTKRAYSGMCNIDFKLPKEN